MRLGRAALLSWLVAAAATGCAGVTVPSAVRASTAPGTSVPPFTAGRPTGADCPPVSRSGSFAVVDYVDFLQLNGRSYLADLVPVAPVTSADLGARVMWVRCEFRKLNDATGRVTPAPRDGDAAFLAPGTAVYALRGWPSACRLAASHDGRLHVYLGYRPGGRVATPEPCALHRGA